MNDYTITVCFERKGKPVEWVLYYSNEIKIPSQHFINAFVNWSERVHPSNFNAKHFCNYMNEKEFDAYNVRTKL